jgi:hypothetical protein
LFLAAVVGLGLGLVAAERRACARPGSKASTLSFSKSRAGFLGVGTRSFQAQYRADGTPKSLTTNFSVVVPNFLTMRNMVLYDRSRTVPLTKPLKAALSTLRATASRAGVGRMQTSRPRRGKRPIVHWQGPDSFLSNIEVVGGPAIGGIKPASAQVGATLRAATKVQRLARGR